MQQVNAAGEPGSARVEVTPDARDRLAADLSALLQQLGVAAVLRHGASKGPKGSGAGSGESPAFTIAGYTFIVEQRPKAARKLDLTPRQQTIVLLISDGLTNREIAERLGISLHTVRRHVEALLRRLDVPSRAAAAMLLAGNQRERRA